MGPKKGKKGKGDEEEDTSTENLKTFYMKMSKELEAPMSQTLIAKLNDALEEDEHLHEILINEKIGEFGARALSNALMKTNKGKGFIHCNSIRIWEGDIGDEGVRAIHQFLINTNNSSVHLIEFLNCNIGPLGCEFISRIFEPSLPSNLQYLTLDYNVFGNEGASNLLLYIRENHTLTYLSLAYCGIDETGIKLFDKYLSENTVLTNLILMGNPLKDEGVMDICTYLIDNQNLEELNINNVAFGENKEAIMKLTYLMEKNKNLVIYHCKFNLIPEENFSMIVATLKGENGKHVYQFNIDEKYPKELFDLYFKAMKGRKYRKKKGGKKKKGKKK